MPKFSTNLDKTDNSEGFFWRLRNEQNMGIGGWFS